MTNNIAILAGDGIGPEVMAQAVRVLLSVAPNQFELIEAKIGGAAFDTFGSHFPNETLEICKNAKAILFGSVGGPINEAHLPKWKGCETNSILALRKTFNLAANYRPMKVFPSLQGISPLKESLISAGIDLLIIRELVGDIYFGEHTTTTENNVRVARDVAVYTEDQIRDVSHHGFKAARARRKKLTSVDKANVLDTSKLWRTVLTEVSKEYSDVTIEHMLVDNCGMQIIRNPSQFDVIVTSNMFGDILSDAAAVIPGSLGLTPSASLNSDGFGLYEPAGGSAPDIAGKNIANPIAQILSTALMLRFSFGMGKEATAIERAVELTLKDGFATADINHPGANIVGTSELTDQIIKRIQS